MAAPFYSYWGKSGHGSACHRLPYHCLDVGACGVVLLRRLPGLRRRLEALTGLSGSDLETFVRVYLPLHDLGKMRAATGHHGQPPDETPMILRDTFDRDDINAAEAFVRAVLALAGQERLPVPPAETAAIASWWLAGFAVLAEWLGSNVDFFPYRDEILPLEDYWAIAIGQAERAVAASGLEDDPPAQSFVLADCFPELPSTLTPTPLQQWGGRVELPHGPHLFIIEDVTGAGKTEAALILAWRILRREGSSGLYFGLPTMATANRQAVLPAPPEEADYGDETEPAGACCSAWLADSRKKALLAEVGVGTVDQALLAVLASRHQSLRLLGLLDKVLIVDEVHACDAYMNRLLAHLLRAHARAGSAASWSRRLPKVPDGERPRDGLRLPILSPPA